MKKTILILFVLFGTYVSAQEQEIDASKPTNFYTQLFNHLEYNSQESGGNIMGYRAELSWAPSESHLVLAELPILYNDLTNKFGVGDFRARYFYLPYKNYENLVGAFGPSIDVFAPTGSFENGLGSGRWSIQPGITVGLMAADWIQFFPILSYQYTSTNVQSNLPEGLMPEQHGISFQVITPIIFSEKFFVQVTPIYSAVDFQTLKTDRYIQEVFAQYAFSPSIQGSLFYRGIFQDSNHTVRLGLVVYL